MAHAPFKRSEHSERYPFHGEDTSIAQVHARLASLRYDYWETGNYVTAGFDTWVDEPMRNTPRSAVLTIGLCEDFVACWNVLHQDPNTQSLLDATARNTIYYQRSGLVRVRLHRDVIDAREGHMALAIRQALAGPHRDSAGWEGMPVQKKVEHIYKGHLNNHNRRAMLEGPSVPFDDDTYLEPD